MAAINYHLPEEIIYKTGTRVCSGRIREGHFLYYIPRKMKSEVINEVVAGMRIRLQERLEIAGRSLQFFQANSSTINDAAGLYKMAEMVYTRKYPALDFPLVIKFRRQKTVMGTYRKKSDGVVTININAFFKNAPLMLLEYIIAHELSHHHYSGHDKGFYGELLSLCPDHKKKRVLANQFLTLKEAHLLA